MDAITPIPNLVRNDAQSIYTTPEPMSRASSIGECPGAPERLSRFARQLQIPMDLNDCFNSCGVCIYECCCDYATDGLVHETDGLVHESYVKKLEAEIARLRQRVSELEPEEWKDGRRDRGH